MNTSQLQEWAKVGAEARLKAIDEERQAILQVFPDLGKLSGNGGGASSPAARKRGRMSPEARKAQGERMRAYWAERRAEKAGDGAARTTAPKAKRNGGMSAEARKAQGERMKAYWAAKRAEKQAASAEDRSQVDRPSANNGASSSRKSGRKAGRKQGRKK